MSMMIKRLFFSFLILTAGSYILLGSESLQLENPYINAEAWSAVTPYLLPENHPAKKKLDEIFSSERVTLNVDSMKKAGFSLTEHQGLDCVTLLHPDLKKYVIKVYPDYMSFVTDWQKWVSRCEGAEIIRDTIQAPGYKCIFSVPHKWIYPLPAEPSPPQEPGYCRKNFILIAEKMKILDKADNRKKYIQKLRECHLDAIYSIVTELGLSDSLRAFNLPWTKDHKLAFIDTANFHDWDHIDYYMLFEFLAKPMRVYWHKLLKNEGPQYFNADKAFAEPPEMEREGEAP